MSDPLIAISSQFISQKSLSAGLAELLRNGPQTGIVLSYQPNGKAVISFQGKPYPLDIKGFNLLQGQQVIAKLAGEKILLDLVPLKDSNATSLPPETGRSLSAQLASMGFSQPNAQLIAEALLKAGIPLDKTVLKELANFLPDLESNQVSALSFLFDRGLPVNPSLIQYLVQIFSPKPKPAVQTDKLLSDLKKVSKELAKDETNPLSAPTAKKLEEFQHAIENAIVPSEHFTNPDFAEELYREFQNALTSIEAQILSGSPLNQGLSAIVIRLLFYLNSLQPSLAQHLLFGDISSLIKEVTKLHEHLIEQSLRNMPSQSSAEAPTLFFIIPYWESGQNKDMEVLYKEKRKDRKAGNLDLRLEMSKLGPIRVSMQWEHPNLSMTLHVTDEKIGDHLQNALLELKELLTQKGFNVLSIGIHVGDIPDTLQDIMETQFVLPKTGLNVIV